MKYYIAVVYFFSQFGCANHPVNEAKNCLGEQLSVKESTACHDQAFENLKKEPQQATQILKNLCGQKKIARACSNLGFFYEDPKSGSPIDLNASLQYYQLSCELGDGVGCNNLANLYILGRGTAPDSPAGVRHLLKSCELNYAPACYRVSVITMRGKLLKSDATSAAEFMQKACDLGDAIGCNDLGYLYMDGQGVTRDQTKALKYISKACDQGLPRGCGTLGSFYLMGGAESIDYAKAYELIQQACTADDFPSCSNLGFMIETGKGMSADPARAAQFYVKACSGGDLLGCGNLGVLLAEGRGVERNDLTALPHLERACSDRVPEACRYQAIFYLEGRAGLPKSKKTSDYFRKKACEYGDELSCTELTKGFASLCLKDETPAFGCLTGEARMASLCLKTNGLKPSTLIYRFGQAGKIDLAYSEKFEFLEDRWTNGESYRLTFKNGSSTKYELIETITKKSDPPTKAVEIRVEQKKKETNIQCRVPVLGSLNSEIIKKAANLGAHEN